MRRYVKLFKFEEKRRSSLTFSDSTKIRLNPKTHRIQLKSQGINKATGKPVYPTDADLSVSTWVTSPTALRGWKGFHADRTPSKQPTGTSVGYKLNDGTTDLYWDGGTWSAAGASDWNDEATVAANIDTFPVTGSLQVIVNLVTTDDEVTPTVFGICVLMDAEFDYLSSIIGDALVPSLRDDMVTEIDWALHVDTGGTQISLRDRETNYNILSVEAVYNHTTDPLHATDIFSSYDAANEIIETTTGLDFGDVAWIRMKVEPEIHVNWSSQDYTEVEKLPAVIIDSYLASGSEVWARAFVRDVGAKTAVVLDAPYRLDLEIDILLLAEKNRTLFAMIDQSLVHAKKNTSLHWPAVDEEISLRTIVESEFRPRPDLRDQHSATYSIRLENIYLWLKPDESKPLVEEVKLTFSSPDLQGAERYTDVKTGHLC